MTSLYLRGMCLTGFQVPLMLGDYFKDNPKVAAIVDAAIEIVKWFNNH